MREEKKHKYFAPQTAPNGLLMLVCPWLSFAKLFHLQSPSTKASKSAKIRNYTANVLTIKIMGTEGSCLMRLLGPEKKSH